ncbi:MAG: HAD-IA family hydrolase [Clostridia bacterium]|nr:HAD-IA family hydrolase [Clostridia bacterium]
MIDHLIFDFDGTVSDSYPLFVQFFHKTAKKRGFTIPCTDDELYRASKRVMHDAYVAAQCEDVCDYPTFVDDFHELQVVHRNEFQIFPAAKALLTAATEQGKHCYLYTHTGPVVKEMLENMGVSDCFDFILDSSYGFPMKPAPDALLFFLDKFGFDPKSCVMIGDRPIDAHAGMNAGMYGCLWDADHLFPEAQVDFYIKDLSEVKKIVDIN